MSTYNNALRRHRAFMWAAVVLLLLVGQTAAMAMTPAGTQIHNRAEATYTWEGLTRTTFSEQVTVTVQQVAGVALGPESVGEPGDGGFSPAYGLTVSNGTRLYIPYRITNMGNGPDTFALQPSWQGAPGAPALSNVKIYHDRDEDGVPGTSDAAIEDIALDAGESAALLLAINIPIGASDGDEYFTRIAAESEFDATVAAGNTWSKLRVQNTGAHVFIHRAATVDPQSAFGAGGGRPGIVAGAGATLTHTITFTNLGRAPIEDARLWEPLSDGERLLLDTYGSDAALLMNGSPLSVDAVVDPQARLIQDPSGTWGIEIDIDRMQPGQRMIVEYNTEVDWPTDDERFAKQAELHYESTPGVDETTYSNELLFVKAGEYAVRIGPKGVVLAAGEQGLATAGPVFFGERVRFPTVVYHDGTLPGTVELTLAAPPPAGWEVDLFHGDGVTPLVDTNGDGTPDTGPMQPGSQREIVVEVTVPADPALADTPPYVFEVVASFAEDNTATDTTVVQVDDVEAPEDVWDPLLLLTDEGPAVLPGSDITFAVVFGNDSSTDVYDATLVIDVSEYVGDVRLIAGDVGSAAWIEDQIDGDPRKTWEDLGLTDVDGVYDPATHTLRWNFAHIPPGVGGKVVFAGRVPVSTGAGTPIEMTATMASASPDHTAHSNIVQHTVLGEALTVDVSSAESEVAPGDINTYSATVSNLNPSEDFADVEVWMTMPEGLTYVQGSSRLNGQVIDDLAVVDGRLRYIIPSLPKDDSVRIRFDGLVNALAEGEIVVSAQATFETPSGVHMTSNKATVRTPVRAGMFGDDGLIMGRIVVGDDRPVAGVRVLLDDGRYAVTDTHGFYSLMNVEPGPRGVRLDPSSLRELEDVPAGVDASDVRIVRAVVPRAGVAVVDFALVANIIGVHTDERLLEGNDQ